MVIGNLSSSVIRYTPAFKKIAKWMTCGALTLTITVNLLDPLRKIYLPVGDPRDVTWDHESYWYYPWGESVVHRGIDLFGDLGTEVISGVSGMVVDSGYSNNGGNYVYILSFDLKVYYYAHLSKRNVSTFDLVSNRRVIGLMGDTGNAIFTPSHLHYSIYSPIPMLRYLDLGSKKGWQKMFYLDPERYLNIGGQ